MKMAAVSFFAVLIFFFLILLMVTWDLQYRIEKKQKW